MEYRRQRQMCIRERYVGRPFKFARYGQSGMEVSEIFPHLSSCVDDIAVVRSLHTNSNSHPTGFILMNTGVQEPGASPSMGSWLNYGLGTENQNMPGFVVLPDGGIQGGIANYSNSYLPTAYQGTVINTEGVPIVDLKPPQDVTLNQQSKTLDLINDYNQDFLDSDPSNAALLGRMKSYELAFRMQMAVPEALDVEGEPDKLKELYGLNLSLIHI